MRNQNIDYSEEVRERSVRLLIELARELGSQWAAITSVSAKLGCGQDTLCRWVREADRQSGEKGSDETASTTIAAMCTR